MEEDLEELYLGEELSEGTFSEESEGEHEIIPKTLSREEACSCLGILGKPAGALGIEVAFLQIKAKGKMLTDVSVISSFPHLMFVDVSRNFLKAESLTPFGEMQYLVKLYADENTIESCKLPPLPYIQVLTLSKNQIEEIDGLECPLLNCLDLSFNRVTHVKNLGPPNLNNLKILDLHKNYLESTSGIQCPTLERLYLADNKIESIEGLEILENLQVLHLRNNPLNNLDGFSKTLRSLTYINLRDCQIFKTKEIKKMSVLPHLDTLILLNTPVEENLGDESISIVLSYIPILKRINKSNIQQEDIENAEEKRREREIQEAQTEEFSEEEEYVDSDSSMNKESKDKEEDND